MAGVAGRGAAIAGVAGRGAEIAGVAGRGAEIAGVAGLGAATGGVAGRGAGASGATIGPWRKVSATLSGEASATPRSSSAASALCGRSLRSFMRRAAMSLRSRGDTSGAPAATSGAG